MLARIRRLPSPALVLSALALIVAVAGGTFAVANLTKPKVQKIAKKVAKREIRKRVDGLTVRGFDYQMPSSSGEETLFSLNGLTVKAICSAGRVDATTEVNDAYISVNFAETGGSPTVHASRDPDFDTGETFLTNGTTGAVEGEIDYVQPNGRRVSVTMQADMAADCTVSGHAFASR